MTLPVLAENISTVVATLELFLILEYSRNQRATNTAAGMGLIVAILGDMSTFSTSITEALSRDKREMRGKRTRRFLAKRRHNPSLL